MSEANACLAYVTANPDRMKLLCQILLVPLLVSCRQSNQACHISPVTNLSGVATKVLRKEDKVAKTSSTLPDILFINWILLQFF